MHQVLWQDEVKDAGEEEDRAEQRAEDKARGIHRATGAERWAGLAGARSIAVQVTETQRRRDDSLEEARQKRPGDSRSLLSVASHREWRKGWYGGGRLDVEARRTWPLPAVSNGLGPLP